MRGGAATPAPLPADHRHGDAAAADRGGRRLHDPQVLREGGQPPPARLTTDNWDPTAGVGDVSTFTPTYTVAATGGTHTTVQAALDAAVAAGGTTRIYIKVNPGTYRETVCHQVERAADHALRHDRRRVPDDHRQQRQRRQGVHRPAATDPPWNPCAASTAARRRRHATAPRAAPRWRLRARLPGQEPHLRERLTTEVGTSNIQAVALMTQNDKTDLRERPRARQPGLALREDRQRRHRRSAPTSRTATSRATPTSSSDARPFVLDNCEIKYARRAPRRHQRRLRRFAEHRLPQRLRPADHQQHVHRRTACPTPAASCLGRAWDEGQTRRRDLSLPAERNRGLPERPGRHPKLGARRAHRRGARGRAPPPPAAPTARSRASGRSIPANRLWEFMNTGAGAAP